MSMCVSINYKDFKQTNRIYLMIILINYVIIKELKKTKGIKEEDDVQQKEEHDHFSINTLILS